MTYDGAMTATDPLQGVAPGARTRPGSGTVLVVDDEPHLVGMYASMLEDEHTVVTATSGEGALDALTDAVDVVLLDRRMPDIPGDDVLDTIHEEGCECQVAMVTSVEPEADVADLPFDAYLVKPVRKRDVRELVDDLLLRKRYDSDTRELLSTAARLATLQSQLDEAELASDPEYRELRERWDALDAAGDLEDELTERGDTGLVFRDVLATLQTHE